LIVDVTWGGGITFAHKAAAIAEAHSTPIAFHDCSGPVTLCSSTHLALATPNVAEQEIARGFYYGWYGDMVDIPPPLENGFITIPGGPGLGLALSDKMLASDGISIRTTAN
jgi:galactonate dehydratase